MFFEILGLTYQEPHLSQYNVGIKVSKANLKPGDLVFFKKTYNKAGITHVGIYTGNNEFISATSSKGIKIDSLNSTYWGPKYYGATRVLEDKHEKLYDVSTSSPSYTAILTLSNRGIISGYPDGAFRPEANITRAEAAAIINRVLKKTTNEPIFVWRCFKICLVC